MAAIVLRIRLISGDVLDVRYDDPESSDEAAVIEHVVSTLADSSGVLRCSHGERLVIVYSRGVEAVEVSPRGAVL
jgi:hypothetical protein